ncbi:phosphatidylinositol 4,5-bisphosphate 5-phosphatase A-like isoform X1 [Cimex lectularius]|uniref:Inositol polyphosphate-related phosphatase domain-containing protein n=1 Tax=Cimex lectularius TaxID=79782 RepID=A0A8I6RER2_CIMLE|nr:phosphatidylinositol 4,5-bisphosphate 5-phosphatase A-like isoform X1 [Cimex lectularius]
MILRTVVIAVVLGAAIIGVLSTDLRQFKIHIATWNVNGQYPPEKIDRLLGLEAIKESGKPDLVIVGIQEISVSVRDYLSNLVSGNKWSGVITNTLLEHDYFKVNSFTMIGIGLYVFALSKHQYALDVTSVEEIKVRTGFGGTLGNKGALVLNFRWFETDFSVINAHLPAHDDGNAKRIEDFKTIDSSRKSSCRKPADFLFWLGDLNFRLDDLESLDANRIQHMLAKGQSAALLEKDQLKTAQKEGAAFVGWAEDEISFKPTFKMVPRTGRFNLKRRPSWTDRILYKSDSLRNITQISYESLTDYVLSDHTPVIAQFYITLDTDRF